MRLTISISSRTTRAAALLVLVAGSVGLAATAACIAAPPADPPQIPETGPTIIQDAVQPPRNEDLTALPPDGVFIIPVRVSDPTIPIQFRVFIDYVATGENSFDPYGYIDKQVQSAMPAVDGGITDLRILLSWTESGALKWNFDPNACHTIWVFVADSFQTAFVHTPDDPLAADSVIWHYAPNGPGACTTVDDAGDGSFPPEASSDAGYVVPPVVPPI
jgi:hypothetical protein